ncbi:MAG TPA: ATP-binding protein [Candidatus Eisenbacteria bacterium]|nr:ATP-binding protein [Candidatus Eisenbacteria bacterium]
MVLPRPRSLRARLTLWYTAVLAALLVLFGAAALVLLDRALRANVDASLTTIARTIAESSATRETPGGDLDDALDALLGPGLARRFFELLDPRGRPDPRLGSRGRARLPLTAEALRNAEAGRETFETLGMPGVLASAVRVLTFPITEDGRFARVVQVGLPLDEVESARSRFLLILLSLAPFALAAAAAGGRLLATRALAPVDAMVDAARRIEAEDLSRRLRADGAPEEIGRLAGVLNDMLGRLEASFSTARRFSADAAHELRTPLTILKGEIEVSLRSPGAADDRRRVLESCLEEVDRLIALVEDLLFLARADAGAVEVPRTTVDLSHVVGDALPALRALAEQAGVGLAPAEGTGPLCVRGSEPLLFRVVFNLVDNAIKYSGAGHGVTIALQADGGRAVLDVTDDGPGVPPADRERIFDRFYRGDPARGRGGTGLGLAVTRSIVVVHGGDVRVVDGPGGRGTSFRVTLPLAD